MERQREKMFQKQKFNLHVNNPKCYSFLQKLNGIKAENTISNTEFLCTFYSEKGFVTEVDGLMWIKGFKSIEECINTFVSILNPVIPCFITLRMFLLVFFLSFLHNKILG